jgi:hypothetical protein
VARNGLNEGLPNATLFYDFLMLANQKDAPDSKSSSSEVKQEQLFGRVASITNHQATRRIVVVRAWFGAVALPQSITNV